MRDMQSYQHFLKLYPENLDPCDPQGPLFYYQRAEWYREELELLQREDNISV